MKVVDAPWSIFTNEKAGEKTADEVNGCTSGIPGQLFRAYERPPGVPLLCFGPYEVGKAYVEGVVKKFTKECEWAPPCEPVEINDNFVAFEFINVTDLTPEQRFEKCCKKQSRYAASGSHFFFRTLEDRTKVFQQRKFISFTLSTTC